MSKIDHVKLPESGEFTILFEKLDEEIELQRQQFNFNFEPDSEISKTVSLFKEYKESIVEESYTTLTRG